MAPIQWNNKEVSTIVKDSGYDFARLRTPHGWRTNAKRFLLPKNKKSLEGNCFHLAYKLASIYPDSLYYCEGYAENLPHAWVALKNYNEPWCIDITWPYFTYKNNYHEWDHLEYSGVKFEVEDVKSFMLDRLKDKIPTSMSMLKYYSQTKHLIK